MARSARHNQPGTHAPGRRGQPTTFGIPHTSGYRTPHQSSPDLPTTIDELAAAATGPPEAPAEENDIKAKIADCPRKLAQYRVTLDAGADPATVACWITETERANYQAAKHATPPHTAPSMSRAGAAGELAAEPAGPACGWWNSPDRPGWMTAASTDSEQSRQAVPASERLTMLCARRD